MIDLTGANLVSYLLRIIRDVVNRNPRFKQTLGEVTFTANTILKWKDAWVSITSVTTSGTRLSPDYFMCTQIGRAILAKVGDKNGQFIEWTRETDKTRLTPDAGVYYLNVDFFSDQTRDLGLTVQKYRWVEGKLKQAQGTVVYFRPGIDVTTVYMSDAATSLPVQFTGFNQSAGAFAYLVTPTQQLTVTYSGAAQFPDWDTNQTYAQAAVVNYGGVAYLSLVDGNTGVTPGTDPTRWYAYSLVVPQAGTPLVPLTDFWYQRVQSVAIASPTKGGNELLNIPSPYISVTFTDQSGYALRPGLDYNFQGPQWIMLSQFSPPGSIIYANMVVKLNPYTTAGTDPENILQVNMTPNETLAPGQVFIHTPAGNFTNPTVNADGTLTLPQLLQPGDWLRWEVRINSGQVRAVGKKWELNNLTIVDPTTIQYTKLDREGNPQPVPTTWVMSQGGPSLPEGVSQASAGQPLLTADGRQQYVFPGLRLAIGDNVVVGDQCAIIVSPALTETYEVFGSKENLTFTLEVKANDLQTASDLTEMLKRELLINRRTDMESDGLTIFELTRSEAGQARDASATAPQYVFTVQVSASADWKVYVPLVTRLVSLEINEVVAQTDFLGKLQVPPRMEAFGVASFIPYYG
jgi:hypothetical protein